MADALALDEVVRFTSELIRIDTEKWSKLVREARITAD